MRSTTFDNYPKNNKNNEKNNKNNNNNELNHNKLNNNKNMELNTTRISQFFSRAIQQVTSGNPNTKANTSQSSIPTQSLFVNNTVSGEQFLNLSNQNRLSALMNASNLNLGNELLNMFVRGNIND
jgi:hypothetical protein